MSYVFKKLQYQIFLENINTDLTVFQNINTLYYLLDFNPFYLWYNLHYILHHYFDKFIYDVARDGSWLMINNEKYLFDNINSVIVK